MNERMPPDPWRATASEVPPPRAVRVQFSGRRLGFFGLLTSSLILLVPTLGLYRFWLVTRKRNFYWGHTEVDGDALEYTGTPVQLLIGFLLAVLIFLPIYIALFYVTVRLPDYSGFAYLVLLPLFYFLMGYASYRSRRFRLSRTLWRGIRFQQTGNAWVYALKRFWWTALTIATLGLTYPLMAKSLWAYRINNTWFGDRRFSFSGKVRTIAAPFYGAYAVLVVLIAASVWQMTLLGNLAGKEVYAVAAAIAPTLLVLGIGYMAWLFVTTRIDSRYWSSVSVGAARLTVRISALAIALQQMLYVVLLTILVIVFGFAASRVIDGLPGGSANTGNLSHLMRDGSSTFFLLIGLYLLFLGLWSVLSDLVLAFGYWKIVARGTRIENVDALANIRAAGIESPLAGEGLADALNVGAY